MLKTLSAFALGLILIAGVVKADDKKKEFANPTPGKCPVSGKDCKPESTAEADGKTYAFCCNGCVKKFTADPSKFIKKEAK